MKLFVKNKFVWNEPWFFCQRIRDRRDWFRALLVGIGTWVVITTAILLAGRGNFQWWQSILIGLGAGAVVQLALEASMMRREVSIDEKSIDAFCNAGQLSSLTTYPLNQIIATQIVRSEEANAPFSTLMIQTVKERGVIGIPRTVRLEQLAQTLHQLNVPVMLSGWKPATDSLDQNEYLYCSAEPSPTEAATVEAIPEAERPLLKLPEMILGALISHGLLLLWLGLIAVAGIFAYQQRQNVSIWVIATGAILAFASLTIPFTFAEMFGNYWAASYMIGLAKKRIARRSAPLIKSFDERTVAVELIKRETWAAAAPKVIDYGFMRVDSTSRRILYEGNLERWSVPLGAVRLCKVEEVQYGTAGESATGQLRCFVVFVFQKDSEPFEIGLRVADKEIGKESDTRRMRKAVELYEGLVEAITAAPQAACA
ncbi:MAG: hypothetical protein ACTHK7_13755 [Aureliella sp.]